MARAWGPASAGSGVLVCSAALLLAACSSCGGTSHGDPGGGPAGGGGRPRASEGPRIGAVYELPGGDAPATPPANGCRTGRIASEEEGRCGDDDDCVLTNWEGYCQECTCPFAYYATSRAWLADQLRPDHPIPSCVAIECDRSCSHCGLYDAEHRPARAVCRGGHCAADPPPPGEGNEGWY